MNVELKGYRSLISFEDRRPLIRFLPEQNALTLNRTRFPAREVLFLLLSEFLQLHAGRLKG